MKIGLYLSCILTRTHKVGVWGDEIWCEALLKGLKKNYPEHQFYLFGENLGCMPETDIAINFYNTKKYGKKNIYIQQNYCVDEAEQQERLKPYLQLKQDKIATISGKYAKEYGWKLLYPCVDLDLFYPVKFNQESHFEVAYIGSNIKGQQKTNDYLRIPEIRYGIFGNGFNKSIIPEDTRAIYTSSLINLNFGFSPEKDIIIARPYQISACKGFIVSEWTKSLEEVFGDSIEYIKPEQNPALRIKEVLAKINESPKWALEKREKAYKIVKEDYNSDIQSKELWRWINE